MKLNKRVLPAVLATVVVLGLAIPVMAAVTKTITVETDVKVYVNDVGIDAGDTHGNPEAFIYNGTTYIAAKAVSNSLGENVKWDGKSRSVYIGTHEGSSYYVMDVCPPYHSSYVIVGELSMGGIERTSALRFARNYEEHVAQFNLNGKYDTLSFIVGPVDGQLRYREKEILEIYLDGELVSKIEMDSEEYPKTYRIALNGAKHLKIKAGTNGGAFALADMKVS